MGRLQSTTIKTNIRPKGQKKERQFSWIESWTDLIDDKTGQSLGFSLTVSEWFYEGVLMDGGLLAIDPEYFGSLEAVNAGSIVSPGSMPAALARRASLFHCRPYSRNPGQDGTYRRFKFEMQAIVRQDDLPGFMLALELGKGEPSIRMIRRNLVDNRALPSPKPKRRSRQTVIENPRPIVTQLNDATIERVRRNFPGWDIYALKAEFDAWLAESEDRMPSDYQSAFYGFARRHHVHNAG